MKQVIKGNHAVSHGVRLSRVEVISAYPITPQTTIVEELSEMCSQNRLEAKFLKVESEHSAMAALIGAATAGARTFTASSGNGLLYMHEVLHWTAGARLPIVMANVNRAVGGVWNIWADQGDSLAQQTTGWVQIYCESNQEVLDGIIIGFKLAEKIMLPVMIAYDAFFLSHTSEIVDIPEPETVDAFLPAYAAPVRPNFDDPRMFGGFFPGDCFYEQRYTMHRAFLEALSHYPGICREFEKNFGRAYDLTEGYRIADAEIVVAAAGTICSVSRLAVDRLREAGIGVGLMKIRMFRPPPVQHWREILGHARTVVVIDRNLTPGMGGSFAHDIRAALFAQPGAPRVFGAVAGLGGRDVTAEDVDGIVRWAINKEFPDDAPLFWGLKN